MEPFAIVITIVTLVIGLAAGRFLWRSKSGISALDMERLRTERDGFRSDAERLKIENTRLETILEKDRESHEEKLKVLEEAEGRLKLQFQSVAAEILKGHSTTFTKQNKEQLDTLLNPLGERIKEFQQSLQKTYTENATERGVLKEQIKNLTSASAEMMTETSNLTRALKGDSQAQGAWGEMILETILQKSGLRAGEEYEAQASHTDSDGNRRRPDFLVKLPGEQRIVVDSKVSLKAYEAHTAAENEDERTLNLRAHVQSMRAHIKGLSEKNYQLAADSQLDYVIMFVPIEGALAAALQEDPEMTAYAIDQNVQIATPNILVTVLRTIANVWQVERRNRNADEIAKRAGSLYDKFVGFTDDMVSIGGRLDQARQSYDAALGKMSTGRGNIVRQLELLKGMGAKAAKSIPEELLEDPGQEALREEIEYLADPDKPNAVE
ncbi:MAG: DNA recombination protein RmuC [Pseudomonadota bacterium]|nr:DNA recombination protein RmuC [Pseudomonadota bacterium]